LIAPHQGVHVVQSVTFLGEVQGGRIITRDSLIEFEGKQVLVTLITPDGHWSTNVPTADQGGPTASPFRPDEPDLLEDLGAIRIPPRDVKTLKGRIIDVGQLAPRVYPSDEEQ
jgi:hypothetical protein